MTDRADMFDETKATGMMDLYSRQIGTFGVDTMKNLTKLRVLIIGCRGVGVETAKNIILAGPGAVTIHDNHPVSIGDLGTNFFFSAEKVGSLRSEAAIDQLKQLNPFVDVIAHTGELSDEFLNTFGAIIVSDDLPLDRLIHINRLCRNKKSDTKDTPILFILGITNGVVATIFTDYGPTHTITDQDGEPAKMNVIDDITIHTDEGENPHLVLTVTAARHGLDDDSVVQISDVEGMVEINKLGPVPLKRVYKKTKDDKGKPRDVLVLNKIRIDHADIPKWGPYKGQGLISEVKPTKTLNFRPLEESLLKPLSESDMGFVKHPHEEKLYTGRGAQIHFARLAVWEFQKKHGRTPKLHSEEDALEVVALAKEVLGRHKEVEGALTVETLDENVLRQTALYYATELCGLTAFMGGVIAQEIIKKFGKYSPIHQWIHLDYFELLSEKVPADATPIGSRYDNQISIFGNAFQEKLGKQNWFMVGCGALGCEYLKGFSLMGLGAQGGVLYVTDMDTIEVSNLSRQFLFRRDNVGQQKSVCASRAALQMNPKMNIKCSEIAVGPDTENKFNDSFWSSLDGVCNALDNIKAREYTDSKCVFYGKPLLESGTLGTKANSEMVIPHKTKSYAEHEGAGEEETIPMCTLRNFPHLIEHCIEWSRAQFTDIFETPPASFNKFVKNPNEFFTELNKQKEAEALDLLENVHKLASSLSQGISYETCIHLAFSFFIAQFRDRIKNLVHAFPIDSVKEDEAGVKVPFWSGSKRFPQPAEYDPEDENQFNFLFNTSNLYAAMLKIKPVRDREEFKKALLGAHVKVPTWEPNKLFMQQVKNEVKDMEDKREGREQTEQKPEATDEEKMEKLKKWLHEYDVKKSSFLEKADFEKDDDNNFHIDFITSCANMRAWNYHIQTATRHKCKMIAGKIIPAVATTTAMITGVVEMELYKLALGLDIDKFCNSNINLAVSDFKLFEPIGPKKAKEAYDPDENEVVIPVPPGWTVWDKILIDKGDLTVQEFVDLFPTIHYDCKIVSLFFKQPVDGVPIWLDFPVTTKQKETVEINSPKKISDIYLERFKTFPEGRNYLLVYGSVQNAEDRAASVPPIMIVFRK